MAGLATQFGSGAMTNSIGEIENTDTIFAIGTNTTEAHPIIAQKVFKAQNKGASLVVADPRKTELATKADVWLRPLPGTNVALLKGMMKVILDNNLVDEEFIEKNTENYVEFKASIDKVSLQDVAETTQIPVKEIEKAAKLYAESNKSSILYTMGITQHTTGTDGVSSIANLAMMTGNIGRESTGVNPLRGQNNVQGACDLGGLPNVFTGYQKVTDPEAVDKFSQEWQVDLNDNPGTPVTEMMKSTGDQIRAMYILGENPMVTEANLGHISEALEELDFLVVQDLFLTETAEKADVVLPACSYAEKEGSFTNTERRVQKVRPAVDPIGESKPDWQIMTELSSYMGYPMNYNSPKEIMEEIRRVTPSYQGISYDRIENDGVQWPCPSEEHQGTPYLHKDGNFARGKGEFQVIDYQESAEIADENYPYILTTGRMLYHYHSTLTRKVKELNEEAPEAQIEISCQDGEKLGVESGDLVKVYSRRGEVNTVAFVTEKVAPGVVYMSFHYKEAAANRLTNDALDPQAKTPELKVSAVQIEKIK